jgi:hypothetical protein
LSGLLFTASNYPLVSSTLVLKKTRQKNIIVYLPKAKKNNTKKYNSLPAKGKKKQNKKYNSLPAKGKKNQS